MWWTEYFLFLQSSLGCSDFAKSIWSLLFRNGEALYLAQVWESKDFSHKKKIFHIDLCFWHTVITWNICWIKLSNIHVSVVSYESLQNRIWTGNYSLTPGTHEETKCVTSIRLEFPWHQPCALLLFYTESVLISLQSSLGLHFSFFLLSSFCSLYLGFFSGKSS